MAKVLSCGYCGDEAPVGRLSSHMDIYHSGEVNWVRGKEVYLGIRSSLIEASEDDVEERLEEAVRNRAKEPWRHFISDPQKFLQEYGLPEMGGLDPKRELQTPFGFGTTAGFKRADLVFVNPEIETAVIVENKNRYTESAAVQARRYAGLLMDDYPNLSQPKLLANFRKIRSRLQKGPIEGETEKEGVTGDIVIDNPVRVSSIPVSGRLTVFQLSTELQEHLDVRKHLK